ncbi:hypothetical protein PspLS_03376 [Pyricularia sp. CBS 133598]|nr:hypothetical protein PspLS_03376 [Pyricularia sp. CBS 133598]
MASPRAGTTRTDLAYRDSPLRPKSVRYFHIAIYCSLAVEAEAAIALLERRWDNKHYQVAGDPMNYTLGAIGQYNVVIVHMAGKGKEKAATAATNCQRTFPNIMLSMVFGVCGGVPRATGGEDIFLGDVLISGKVIQYDFGTQTSEGFDRKESLGENHTIIGSLLGKLQTSSGREEFQHKMDTILRGTNLATLYPGAQHDRLFEATYEHNDKKLTCDNSGCDGPLVRRTRLQHGSVQSVIHIGTIYSGDTVFKSGKHRDEKVRKDGIIGFEMEAAGIWGKSPCFVMIKGVSDYADSHKTKTWQQYAASRAAASAKVFLDFCPDLTTFSEPRLSLEQSAASVPQPVSQQHATGPACKFDPKIRNDYSFYLWAKRAGRLRLDVTNPPSISNILELDQRIIALGAGIKGMNVLFAMSLIKKFEKYRRGDISKVTVAIVDFTAI